jgi:hypothetical protein
VHTLPKQQQQKAKLALQTRPHVFQGYNAAHTMHHFFFSLECCAGAAAAVEQAVKLGQHSGNKAFSFVGLAY